MEACISSLSFPSFLKWKIPSLSKDKFSASVTPCHHSSSYTYTTLTLWGCVQATNDYPKISEFDKSCEAPRKWGLWRQLEATRIQQHLQKLWKHSAHKKIKLYFNVRISSNVYLEMLWPSHWGHMNKLLVSQTVIQLVTDTLIPWGKCWLAWNSWSYLSPQL